MRSAAWASSQREALFLDDKPENVEGARAVGMQAEMYSTWEAFTEHAPRGRYNLPMLYNRRRSTCPAL